MAVKLVGTPCLQYSPNDAILSFRCNWLKTTSWDLTKSRCFVLSSKNQRSSYFMGRTRACKQASDNFSNEEFGQKIHDLAFEFEISDDKNDRKTPEIQLYNELIPSNFEPLESYIQNPPLDWPINIEMKANSVNLPLSLRMIKKKKKKCEEGIIEASESAYCSVKKAFSSMVFIIRELHSYTLQMRELLFYEDLKGILTRVQSEMHASFVWLFQQVFSHTPTFMVYVMIFLANFTVHSMSMNPTAVHAAVQPPCAVVELESSAGVTSAKLFDSTVIKSFSVIFNAGKSASVDGGQGGGGNAKPVASGADGDGWAHRGPIVEDDVAGFAAHEEEDEVVVWNSMVEEASRMKGQVFVSPVKVEIEGDGDYQEFFRTELGYQMGLAQEPNNVLLLANYAQFLYLVAHDYDRAEEYFKRAIQVEPKDAEAHNKYGNFLWQVRNDLWAAEQTFLEAISADPSNSVYAAKYAHFLWNTGREDTCFPLNDDTLDL